MELSHKFKLTNSYKYTPVHKPKQMEDGSVDVVIYSFYTYSKKEYSQSPILVVWKVSTVYIIFIKYTVTPLAVSISKSPTYN